MKLWDYHNRYYYESGMPDSKHPTFTLHYVRKIMIGLEECGIERCAGCEYERKTDIKRRAIGSEIDSRVATQGSKKTSRRIRRC